MTEYDTKPSHLSSLPTEVLLLIFTFLPGRQLTKCRQVCLRWMLIVDELTRSDALWRKHCKTDFGDVYQIARIKARVGLLWFHIYRSLALWPNLALAKENRDEFASASSVNDEICNFKVLRDGIIGVHKRGSIIYYDIETLEQSKRGAITGDYICYTENDDTMVIKNYHLQLFVVRKIVQNPHHETNVTFDNVKIFMLVGREIYYVTVNNEIYLCKLDDSNLTGTFITQSEESVLCLSYSDGIVHVLTFQRNIYSLINRELELMCCLDGHSNLLHILRLYNLLDNMDWRIFHQWLCILRYKVPDGPLREIITVRTYGDVIFVGCNWGVLRIYYAPYLSGEFDFYNAEPVKQYNFMERSDCPVLTRCPILQVDVLESEDGHTVIVGMPKKIAVLYFVHSFKRTASVAMLPYSDTQRVKLLKME